MLGPREHTKGSMQSQTISAHVLAPLPVMVVGDVMLDRYWFGEVERISPEAPVPVLKVERIEERLGGAGNVARNITALNGECLLIGAIGADEAADRLIDLADDAGVQHHLLSDPAQRTTVKLRMIGRQQQLLRADFEAKPQDHLIDQRNRRVIQYLERCGAMVLSDYGKGMLVDVQALIAMARHRPLPPHLAPHLPPHLPAHRPTGCPASLPAHLPADLPEPPRQLAILVDPKGDDWRPYRGASIITPNRSELRAVIGRWHDEDDLSIRVRALIEALELKALLLTRSEEGMSLFDENGRMDVPAFAREVYDVSGAGDTVIAVLAIALSSGYSLRQAVPLANKAAGIVVGKLGTAVCSRQELFE